MILIRYLLIGLIVYLIFRSFSSSAGQPSSGPQQQNNDSKPPVKKVSKEIGEYVDYEEVKK
jgi:hypothetical protein